MTGRVAGWLALACAAGCGADRPAAAPPPDPVAAALGRPAAVLIVDPGRSDADRAAARTFPAGLRGVIPVVLDLRSSANRAVAARYHPSTTQPTVVCLTASGIIVCHVDGPDPASAAATRPGVYTDAKPDTDSRFAALQDDARRSGDVSARMALADFLLDHTNDREAIPYLDAVAHDEGADLPTRVRAWVAVGRAHLWVGEPEKARHAAQALIAELGPRTTEAVAGGNLVRGLQDTKAKRFDRAGDELRAAVAASPDSAYGREAAGLLGKLPHKGG